MKQEKPVAIENPDLSSVIVQCQNYVDALHIDGYHPYDDKDLKMYVFEAAMVATFGETIWQWVTARKEIRAHVVCCLSFWLWSLPLYACRPMFKITRSTKAGYFAPG